MKQNVFLEKVKPHLLAISIIIAIIFLIIFFIIFFKQHPNTIELGVLAFSTIIGFPSGLFAVIYGLTGKIMKQNLKKNYIEHQKTEAGKNSSQANWVFSSIGKDENGAYYGIHRGGRRCRTPTTCRLKYI